MADVGKIQIEDLASPILTGIQRAALDHGEHTPVVKSVKAVLSAAVDNAGLDDLGSDDFHEHLALWLSEVIKTRNERARLRSGRPRYVTRSSKSNSRTYPIQSARVRRLGCLRSAKHE